MYEEYIKNKKVVLRFLKELGLLNVWKKYVKKHRNTNEWYKKEYTDSIIGDTSFTSFLKKEYGVTINTTASELFRYWAIYNDVPHKFKYKMLTLEKEFKEDVFIDKTTKMMSLKNVPYD